MLEVLSISLPRAASEALGIGPRRGLLLQEGGALGEASPLPGRSRDTVDAVRDAIARGEHTPSLDFARWAIATPRTRGAIASQILLDDPSTALRIVARAPSPAYKLKLRPGDDPALLDALRRLAPTAVLRADANRAFASANDVPWEALARAGVEWIEEPCADLDACATAPVPIALDESLLDAPDAALALVRARRVAAVVLKPTLLGARVSFAIAAEARSHGARTIVSHAFESEVGRRAAEELARRIAPHEIHGLAPFRGIEGYGTDEGLLVTTLLGEDETHADPALV